MLLLSASRLGAKSGSLLKVALAATCGDAGWTAGGRQPDASVRVAPMSTHANGIRPLIAISSNFAQEPVGRRRSRPTGRRVCQTQSVMGRRCRVGAPPPTGTSASERGHIGPPSSAAFAPYHRHHGGRSICAAATGKKQVRERKCFVPTPKLLRARQAAPLLTPHASRL